jgi:hypothetical protein
MKKQSIYLVRTIKLTKLLVITSAVILFTQTTIAQTRAVAVIEPVIGTASIKHIDNPRGNRVFQIQYDNQSGERFSLTIKDVDGTIVFQDTYADTKFDKRFQLPEGLSDKLKFIIKSLKSNNVQTFEVSTNTRVIEEIVVKKAG